METADAVASPQAAAGPRKEPENPTAFEKYIQPCLAELGGSILFMVVAPLSVITGPLRQRWLVDGHWGSVFPFLLVPFWLCQLSGGILGALLARSVMVEDVFSNRTGGGCMVQEGSMVALAVSTELMLSSLLILIVQMGALAEHSKTQLVPFCISFTLTMGILVR
ncbi:aquaporin-8-like [Macrochelys suwanniensis]